MELRDSRRREACRSRCPSSVKEAACEAEDATAEADALEPFEWKLVRSIAFAKRPLLPANVARRLLSVGTALFPREEAAVTEVAAKFAKATAFP